MDLSEYQRRSVGTDRMPAGLDGLRLALLGVAGEAGSAASEAKKSFRDEQTTGWLQRHVGEELGDLLWYVAAVARRLDLDLDRVAADNLDKNMELWGQEVPESPQYDTNFPPEEQLLRTFRVKFQEDRTGPVPIVQMYPLGELKCRIEDHRRRRGLPPSEQLGDRIDDNAVIDDGYRYHDVIHLAHAAVLGWSPVLRALMGAKRKHDVNKDRIDDGARAIAIEEGLAAFVFNYAEERDFKIEADTIDWDIIKHARRTTQGLEVHDQPAVAWSSTYEQAFDVFLALRAAGGGVVECDLDARQVRLVDDGV